VFIVSLLWLVWGLGPDPALTTDWFLERRSVYASHRKRGLQAGASHLVSALLGMVLTGWGRVVVPAFFFPTVWYKALCGDVAQWQTTCLACTGPGFDSCPPSTRL
jgi:hypothetical protein